MNKEDAAFALNGNEYCEEGSEELFAVFGASDDLMELRGAVYDEVGSWDGGTAYMTSEGLFTASCDNDDCPHEKLARARAIPIHAKWDDGSGFSWRYETTIPHVKFVINEDGETYCEGIVFALADVPA